MVRYSEAVEPGTVWTWNAIGKADGAWQLAPGADEARKGFLLNHLITDELPIGDRGGADQQLRSGHRPGRLVRRARAHPAGRAGEPAEATSPQVSRRRRAHDRRRCRPCLDARAAALRDDDRGARRLARNRQPRRPGQPATRCQAARARHRPQRLRRLPCLRDLVQGMEHLRRGRPARRRERRTARTRPAPSSTASRPTRPASFPDTETIHFPKSCLHCEDPPCVPVCPTGASYKRKEDGIVLVDYDKCIGCKYCAWACPYGAREIDEERQVMTKCTLCVDRIYDATLAPEDRKPACVKACPTGARLFGDVKDPDSEVSTRDPRARRLCADARVGHAAGQPVPAAPHHRGRRRSDGASRSARGRAPATRDARA